MEFLRRLWYALRQRRRDADLAEELASHRAMTQRDLEANGLATADAAVTARRQLGNVTVAREDARGVWIGARLDDFQRDVRYAIRSLIRTPGYTVATLATLAIAIGANAAVFSVVDPLLIRELPVPQPDRLVLLHSSGTLQTLDISPKEAFERYSAERSLFEGVIADAVLVPPPRVSSASARTAKREESSV